MIRRALCTLGLVASLAGTAQAQVLGIPVVNNGTAFGLNVGADVAWANEDYGKGTAVDGHASIGLGFFALSGVISHYSPKGGDGVWSPGVDATLRLLGGPLIPLRVTMQAGVGHWSFGNVGYTHVPIGLALAVTIPNPAFSIKPWLAPRLDVLHTSGENLGDDLHHDVHFGISGGVDVTLLSGLSLRAAYDRVSTGTHPSLFSLGLGYAP